MADEKEQYLREEEYPRSYNPKFAEKIRKIGAARNSTKGVWKLASDDMDSGEKAIKEYADAKRVMKRSGGVKASTKYSKSRHSKARARKR